FQVAGDEALRLRVIAMRQRNAGVGGAAGSCGNARHDLEGNTRRGQFLDLLTTTTEDDGTPALQEQPALGLLLELHPQATDVLLRHGVLRTLLADMDALGIAAAEVEDGLTDETVVEHDVRLLHQAQRAEGQQIRITRTGTNEVDLTLRRFRLALRQHVLQ